MYSSKFSGKTLYAASFAICLSALPLLWIQDKKIARELLVPSYATFITGGQGVEKTTLLVGWMNRAPWTSIILAQEAVV
jgi:hypothetical protein